MFSGTFFSFGAIITGINVKKIVKKGWVQKAWVLKRTGIGIVHTMIWAIKPKCKFNEFVEITITIEEV